jgi:predicted kinase
MHGFGEAFVNAHASRIEQRVREGHVRDGHGDLRCEHVLLGHPVRVVDRIEFDPTLRHMDVASDLAFLAMDLEAHRRRWAMRELVRAYRHAGGNPGGERLRSFYAAHWALVRAKVALIAATTRTSPDRRRKLAQARRLWNLAERLCWRARQPLVIVVCGAAGSGKSTLAAELARRSGLPVVSSDEIRKRHAGLRATERARPEHYTREFTRATYDLLGREALAQLDHKGAVILDATCQTKSQRASLFHRLDLRAVTFLVIHCQVTLETALARAAARMQSPGRISDATPQIVVEQFRSFQALDELMPESVLALDAEQATEVQVAEVTHAVDERIRCGGRTHTRVAGTPCFPTSDGCVSPVDNTQAGA